MRRSVTILAAGILAAIVAYAAIYVSTASPVRASVGADAPELLWLKQEFKLKDADFQRICQLHAGYLPKCRELCSRIAAKNAQLRDSLAKTNTVTVEIELELADVARLRAECQRNMLEHFYQVSRAMPPEEGRRYLEWVQEQTIGAGGTQSNTTGHDMNHMQ
jgi:hypothetical protein